MGHISPDNGSAGEISKEILRFVLSSNILTSNFSAIGCDATNVNTGWKSGVIRLIQQET